MGQAEVDNANKVALSRLGQSRPRLISIERALDVIPGMTPQTVLHAGPPITWGQMCGSMKEAIIGALIYEGAASTVQEAKAVVERGDVKFSPCHENGAVGPMAGIISPSMPVAVVRNEVSRNLAFSPLNEGPGRVLRFGVSDEEVLDRLRWMDRELAPVLRKAVLRASGVDLNPLISEALEMGDECHIHVKAATGLFLQAITKQLVAVGDESGRLTRCIDFIVNNQLFAINFIMAGCKATLDAAHEIEASSVVTTMARNGVEFGIRISGLGNRWFTAPSPLPEGLLREGWRPADANPDLGDSCVTETAGLGGFAVAASPAACRLVGKNVSELEQMSLEMRKITLGEHETLRLSRLDNRGIPIGIDLQKVIQYGVTPLITTGIAHKESGIGMIGYGLVRAPLGCFISAYAEFSARYGVE